MEYSINNNKLTIVLPKRIDTAVAPSVGQELDRICAKNAHSAVVVDAVDVEYIASSGLRVLLALAKKEKQVQVVNASVEVYNVFEMTGFTQIIHCERAMRKLSIDGCPVIGKGGVGTVYRLDDETIIKVFREGTSLKEVQQEINVARKAFVLGVPTAISFETVLVGKQYGLVHELLKAKTLAMVINEDRDNAEKYGVMFGNLMKTIHEIKPLPGTFDSVVVRTLNSFDKISKYFEPEEIDALREIYSAIPEGSCLLHCDLHPKNAMYVNNELMLIDMGEMCYGNPLEDLSHTYSSMVGLVGDYETIIGMPQDIALRVWRSALFTYFGTIDKDLLDRREEQIRVASLIRNFTWLSLSDSFPDELIKKCQALIKERVMNNLDHIREVCKTFNEWEV